MSRLPLLGQSLVALIATISSAATVDSTYIGPSGQQGTTPTNYTISENWMPVGVPNNSGSNSYNVTIPDKDVFVDIQVTISQLTIGDGTSEAVLTVLDTEAAEGSFTVGGDVANRGMLAVFNSNFIVHGNLTNFDVATRTLTGGSFKLSGFDLYPDGVTPVPRSATLQFSGADIVHNASSITLSGNASIKNGNDLNALRNFIDNPPNGTFFVGDNYVFVSPGDFFNSGTVSTQEQLIGLYENLFAGSLYIPAGHKYVQTAGQTTNDGLIDGDVDIQGGTFFHGFSVQGNLTIGNAILQPTSPYYGFVEENLTLSPGSTLQILIGGAADYGQYGQLGVDGTINLGGSMLEVDFADIDGVLRNAAFTIVDGKSPIVGNFGNVANGRRLTTMNGKGSFVVDHDGQDVVLSRFRTIPPPAQCANLSARGRVLTGEKVLIAGLIITGNVPKKIIIRGLGPSLAHAGIASALSDPVLELHGATGSLITTNNDWMDTQKTEIENTGIPPSDEREAAIVATLQPGPYTIVLRGNNDVIGTALLEAYDLATNVDSKLSNISARGFVDQNNPVIAGFIVGGNGNGDSQIVARGLGGQLRNIDSNIIVIGDPRLEVRNRDGVLVAMNDDYHEGDDDVIDARGLRPRYPLFQDFHESALRVSLPPGPYTAILFNKENFGGVGLVELYDLYL